MDILHNNTWHIILLAISSTTSAHGMHRAIDPLRNVWSLIEFGDRTSLKRLQRSGFEPLHWAAICAPRPGVIQGLIANGFSIDHKDRTGLTALHWAVALNCPRGVQVLLANGANPNSKSKRGRTPLYHATLQKNQDIIEYLLAADALIY